MEEGRLAIEGYKDVFEGVGVDVCGEQCFSCYVSCMINVAFCYYSLGMYMEGILYIDEVVELLEARKRDFVLDKKFVGVYLVQTKLYLAINEYKTAKESLQKAQDIGDFEHDGFLKVYPEVHHKQIEAILVQKDIYIYLGKPRLALASLQKCSKVLHFLYSNPNSLHHLNVIKGFGDCYQDIGIR